MDTLFSIRVFCQVAQMRSFAAAATHLDISPAMASKHVQHLERRLATRLLHRTSRHVSLTEDGALYLRQARTSLGELDEAEQALRQSAVSPSGTLRISAPVWMANAAFTQILVDYREMYPDVIFDIDLSGHQVNLVAEGYDLAFRVSQSISEGLIARKVASVRFEFMAAPAYLEREGVPSAAADLAQHALLAYSITWEEFRGGIEKAVGRSGRVRPPVLRTENESLLLLAALSGMGIAHLPRWFTGGFVETGALVPVLPAISGFDAPLYAVYANRSNLATKVRTFLDFAAARLGKI